MSTFDNGEAFDPALRTRVTAATELARRRSTTFANVGRDFEAYNNCSALLGKIALQRLTAVIYAEAGEVDAGKPPRNHIQIILNPGDQKTHLYT